MTYEKGARAERQLEATQEVRTMAKANVKNRRALKKQAAGADDDEF